MPIYDYECERGHVTEHQVPYKDRENLVECPTCQEDHGGKQMAKYVLVRSSIQQGTERIRGDKRVIVDERQVHNTHGKRWRDEGTTGREGGIGRKKIFT